MEGIKPRLLLSAGSVCAQAPEDANLGAVEVKGKAHLIHGSALEVPCAARKGRKQRLLPSAQALNRWGKHWNTETKDQIQHFWLKQTQGILTLAVSVFPLGHGLFVPSF